MSRFVIRGGNVLGGRHRAPGNKNAALPMLAAAVLTDDPLTLRNVPLIEDVQTMLGILEGLGVDVAVRVGVGGAGRVGPRVRVGVGVGDESSSGCTSTPSAIAAASASTISPRPSQPPRFTEPFPDALIARFQYIGEVV
jgi:hypothetical protein